MASSISNGTAGVDEKIGSETSQANAAPPANPDLNVTLPSPQEVDTAAPRKKAPRSKKAKPPPADNTAIPEPVSARMKLPFEFADEQFSEAIIAQIVNASATTDDHVSRPTFDSMTSVMLGQKPNDPFELMAMNHMTGLNALIMDYTGRLLRAKTSDEIELYERALNKLGRTFVSYMDARHRCYRSTGEQRLMVQQNVSVSDGGQAIVANVAQNTGSGDGKAQSAPAMIADQRTAPMRVIDANEESVPVSVERKPLR
jgi:hypothetical protein